MVPDTEGALNVNGDFGEVFSAGFCAGWAGAILKGELVDTAAPVPKSGFGMLELAPAPKLNIGAEVDATGLFSVSTDLGGTAATGGGWLNNDIGAADGGAEAIGIADFACLGALLKSEVGAGVPVVSAGFAPNVNGLAALAKSFGGALGSATFPFQRGLSGSLTGVAGVEDKAAGFGENKDGRGV